VTEEKRKFTINGREFWFTKEQVQKEFGCSKEAAEQMWQDAPIDKATEWLNSLKESTRRTYKTAWKYFEEFTGMTGDQIIEDRKNDKEHKWERKVLEFKQWLLDKGLASYTATQSAQSVRGFFGYYYMKLEYRRADRKKMGERTRKTEDYKFVVEELKQMADVANLHEQYVLVAGKSFGLRAGDFLKFTSARFFYLYQINKFTSASAAILRNVAAPTISSISGTRSSFLTPNISIVGVHA
jgi:hypothetical protein